MYALRQINNGYADYAGSRSDFVIVGHPEFNRGKIGSDLGYGAKWDTRPIPSALPRSLPADRMRKLGNARYLAHIAEVKGPQPTLKERALERGKLSRSMPQISGVDRGHRHSQQQQQQQQQRGDGDSLEMFLTALRAPEGLPAYIPTRTTAGYGNHIRSSPLCSHNAGLYQELVDLKARMRFAPDATREELLVDNNWKYYSAHLRKLRYDAAKVRREKEKRSAQVAACHAVKGGVRPASARSCGSDV